MIQTPDPAVPAAEPPALDRPMFYVWMGTDAEDPEPAYVGVVTVTNADQLTAETQAKGLGLRDLRSNPFHLTALWIWAAMVRRGLTQDKFRPFTQRMEYRPVKEDDEQEDPEGPTDGAPGPSIDSDWP